MRTVIFDFTVLICFVLPLSTVSQAQVGDTGVDGYRVAANGQGMIFPKQAVLNKTAAEMELSPAAELSDLDCMIEPHKVVEVATAASGVVRSINVDRGDIVRRGQVIAKLESGVEEVNLDLSKTRAEFSERKFSRIEEVFAKKGVSHHTKDEAEIEKRLADLEYQRSLELLKMRSIRSPLTGVIVERFISPGEYTEQEKIAKIAQIDPLNVEIIAPVSMIGKTKVGMDAYVFPEQPVGGTHKAKVKIIDRVIDPASGTFGIRLEMKNANYKIPAGVKCKVRFIK